MLLASHLSSRLAVNLTASHQPSLRQRPNIPHKAKICASPLLNATPIINPVSANGQH